MGQYSSEALRRCSIPWGPRRQALASSSGAPEGARSRDLGTTSSKPTSWAHDWSLELVFVFAFWSEKDLARGFGRREKDLAMPYLARGFLRLLNSLLVNQKRVEDFAGGFWRRHGKALRLLGDERVVLTI